MYYKFCFIIQMPQFRAPSNASFEKSIVIGDVLHNEGAISRPVPGGGGRRSKIISKDPRPPAASIVVIALISVNIKLVPFIAR